MVVFVDLISPQFNLAGNYLRDNGVSTLVTSFQYKILLLYSL